MFFYLFCFSIAKNIYLSIHMKFSVFSLSFFVVLCFLAASANGLQKSDIHHVEELNQEAYAMRLTDPKQTVESAKRALALAAKAKDKNAMAESYRILGIGYFYQDKSDLAVSNLSKALQLYKETGSEAGTAKVYNNIGNIYKNIDTDKSLHYFKKALEVAEKLKISDLTAGCYLNIGAVYFKKKNFSLALRNYDLSQDLFTKLDNPVGITQCLQNKGVVYFSLQQLDKAEKFLLEASEKARQNDLNASIAGINLTLVSVYIAKKEFKKAEKELKEGLAFARLINSPKFEQDYTYTAYELEAARGNYEKALYHLRKVYRQDSVKFSQNISEKIGLLQEQYRQQERERRNELIIERQKNNKFLFWASLVVSGLFLLMIGLLVRSIQRKAKTNKQLTVLNSEISQQKEELDWINQRLEQIIEERTKDLQHKNQKLSQYSWHLSHQIRGPIATMKGLMLLEKDKLIEWDEFIQEMDKCLEDIDYKILNINEMLHDPNVGGFSTPDDQV